jgi:hypothetical protein
VATGVLELHNRVYTTTRTATMQQKQPLGQINWEIHEQQSNQQCPFIPAPQQLSFALMDMLRKQPLLQHQAVQEMTPKETIRQQDKVGRMVQPLLLKLYTQLSQPQPKTQQQQSLPKQQQQQKVEQLKEQEEVLKESLRELQQDQLNNAKKTIMEIMKPSTTHNNTNKTGKKQLHPKLPLHL